MNEQNHPIGVFDSGLGGLTVLKEIMALLPSEDTVYFGDTGRTPYGSKSPETVIKYSLQIARFLQAHAIKLLVIACNTASARAFATVRQFVDIPVVEVITPGALAAVQQSQTKRIGVIGTRGTIESGVYVDAIRRRAKPGTFICQQACPLFVSLAEEGWWDHDVTRQIADIYLEPLRRENVDTLLMGCTHYPLLREVIHASIGPQVALIDAGNRVADQVQSVLTAKDLHCTDRKSGSHLFFTSDSARHFQQLGSRFLTRPIEQACRVDIEQYQT